MPVQIQSDHAGHALNFGAAVRAERMQLYLRNALCQNDYHHGEKRKKHISSTVTWLLAEDRQLAIILSHGAMKERLVGD